MLDPDTAALAKSDGQLLDRAAYQRDFQHHDEKIVGLDGWKFERRQYFQEPGSASWQAFRQGDWHKSLQLLKARQDRWTKIAREDSERGSVFHRVRVVAEPLTPYLQWELHALRVQGQSGMPIRVVSSEEVEPLESLRHLPEVVVLGGQVLYEVRYTEAGILDGAVRHVDTSLIEKWESFIMRLYETGQDVVTYVDCHVAHLPAPSAESVPGPELVPEPESGSELE